MSGLADHDLFGAPAARRVHVDADLHYALSCSASDDEAVLRRADWVAAQIGHLPPELGTYDRTAYRELVSAYVCGRHMSCVLLACSVVERHLTLMYRLLGLRWRGSLEEKIERLRAVDAPVAFLRTDFLRLIGTARALGSDLRSRPPARDEQGEPLSWEDELEREARNALCVAVFTMTRLPAHLCRATKGTA